jgi:undecaprenyl diphosphate synthase
MATRLPRHIGVIPDGNRRWAESRGLSRAEGYAAGIEPGLQVLRCAQALGIEEITAYGFTKENVRRPRAQVRAFQEACSELGLRAVREGAALLAVGDTDSALFPDPLRPFATERAPGRVKFNILVNYSWQWDLGYAFRMARADRTVPKPGAVLGSAAIGRVDLVIRWGRAASPFRVPALPVCLRRFVHDRRSVAGYELRQAPRGAAVVCHSGCDVRWLMVRQEITFSFDRCRCSAYS